MLDNVQTTQDNFLLLNLTETVGFNKPFLDDLADSDTVGTQM